MKNKKAHYYILGYIGLIIVIFLFWNGPLWLYFLCVISYWVVWRMIFTSLYGSPDESDESENINE